MKEILAYQCRCGHLHTKKEYISTCKHCGKEICPECRGYEEGLCWDCNDELWEIIDNIKDAPTFEECSRRLIAEFKKEYETMKESGQLL